MLNGHRLVPIVLLLVCSHSPAAEHVGSLLPTNHLVHVHRALDHLNMTARDPGFEKDVGEPCFVLPRLRGILSNPLDLPCMAEEILSAVHSGEVGPAWHLAAGLLEVEQLSAANAAVDVPLNAAASLDGAVTRFCNRAATVRDMLSSAFAGIPPEEKQYAAASLLGGAFTMDDDEKVRRLLSAMGIPGETIEEVRDAADVIDPEPAATRLLKTVQAIDLAAVIAAANMLSTALDELTVAASACREWPAEQIRRRISSFDVCIGTPQDDVYEVPAMLILDPEGDDLYTGAAANANGMRNRPLSVVLDLAGNDRYTGTGLLGPGTALFGVCLVRDLQGNDTYRADYTGQASAFFGAARLKDRAGNDLYDARGLAQASGYAGAGLLEDGAGRDLYCVGFRGQGYAGVRGVGILVDRSGNDLYLAGRRQRDYGRHGDHYLSLAQGFAIGMRPFAGGGVAALVDLEGNDIYRADVYGQGVSYWYSAGFLLDGGGHDSYEVHEYGQGSGIHLSAGLLADAAGDDRYFGHSLSQGNAHDYAIGMLLDRSGNDTYTADHYSQGRGINNSFGLLLDADGKDAYFGREPDSCQGIGHHGGRREYGCIGLLLDLAGADRYTCGADDGSKLQRPDYGMVYDLED